MKSLKDWYDSLELVEEFRSLLSQPAMQSALALLQGRNLPRNRLIEPDPVVKAAAYDRAAGYQAALDDLAALAVFPKRRNDSPMPQEWEHITPDE